MTGEVEFVNVYAECGEQKPYAEAKGQPSATIAPVRIRHFG